MGNCMVRQVPGNRRVRVRYETRTGDWRNRFIEVFQTGDDTDTTLMTKAGDEFHRRFGWRSRIVAIDVNGVTGYSPPGRAY